MNNQKNVVLLTSIGAGLEYYDFIIYALLATFISNNFFPNASHYAALIATFTIFSIGYIVRPIGGIIFGMLGDKFGRKKIFTSTIFLMAISTFLMGIAPTYAQIGLLAPLIFAILRIIQGLSYGAELPGSLTFLTEHADAKHRGKKCGFLTASMSVGISLASFISYLTTHFLSDIAMNAWGFRIPFLLGGVLAFIGYFLRKHTIETPFFAEAKKLDFYSLLKLISGNYKNLLYGLGSVIFPASFVVFGLFMPSYFHEYFNYELSTIYLLTSIGSILMALSLPFLGHLSDKIGRRKILIGVLVGISILMIPLFRGLAHANLVVLCLFLFCYYATLAGLGTSYFVILAEIFPTSMRYTGISVCYNIAYVIAAFLPVILNYLCKYLANPTNISVLFILIAMLTLFSAIKIQDRTGKKLS